MNKTNIIVIIVCTIIVLIAVIITRPKNETTEGIKVSDYVLKDVSEYDLINSTLNPFLKYTESENDIYVRNVVGQNYTTVEFVEGEEQPIGLVTGKKGDVEVLMYLPYNNVTTLFYKDVPMTIFVGEPSSKEDDVSYVGFADGSCYYPKEFMNEENPKICQEYLQSTVESMGYETLDDLLEDVAGEYLIKESTNS